MNLDYNQLGTGRIAATKISPITTETTAPRTAVLTSTEVANRIATINCANNYIYSNNNNNNNNNMVLQTLDLGINGVDNLPPYPGDYAPISSQTYHYTDLDTNLYSQGKFYYNLNKLFDDIFFFY